MLPCLFPDCSFTLTGDHAVVLGFLTLMVSPLPLQWANIDVTCTYVFVRGINVRCCTQRVDSQAAREAFRLNGFGECRKILGCGQEMSSGELNYCQTKNRGLHARFSLSLSSFLYFLPSHQCCRVLCIPLKIFVQSKKHILLGSGTLQRIHEGDFRRGTQKFLILKKLVPFGQLHLSIKALVGL